MTDMVASRVHVSEGETRVETDANICLTTVLGSCVAACIFDAGAGTGGMNHFLLAGDGGPRSGAAERYGAYLMELLVNGLLERGARRERLQGKLFGGAHTGAGGGGIGAGNAAFARRFLAAENIPLMGGSLGGDKVRRIEFWPVGGRARQLYINSPEPVHIPPALPTKLGEVEFF